MTNWASINDAIAAVRARVSRKARVVLADSIDTREGACIIEVDRVAQPRPGLFVIHGRHIRDGCPGCARKAEALRRDRERAEAERAAAQAAEERRRSETWCHLCGTKRGAVPIAVAEAEGWQEITRGADGVTRGYCPQHWKEQLEYRRFIAARKEEERAILAQWRAEAEAAVAEARRLWNMAGGDAIRAGHDDNYVWHLEGCTDPEAVIMAEAWIAEAKRRAGRRVHLEEAASWVKLLDAAGLREHAVEHVATAARALSVHRAEVERWLDAAIASGPDYSDEMRWRIGFVSRHWGGYRGGLCEEILRPVFYGTGYWPGDGRDGDD